MLEIIVLPVLITAQLNTSTPSAAICLNGRKSSDTVLHIIAGNSGRRRAPGPDHGDDPNDEQHDYDLPANKEAGNGRPSRDPYDNTIPNGRNPY